MKLVVVLILCLVLQSRAEPFIFEVINGAQIASSLAEGAFQVAHGVAHVGLDVARGVIGVESENDRILGRALQKAQITLQQILDASREISQASADAANKIQKRIAYLKSTQQAKVWAVTGEAKKRLSKSSIEAQEKGQALLMHFSNESYKYLNKCIHEIVAQFGTLQGTVNAVARHFQEPLNILAAQVEECTKLRASNTRSRQLVRCADEIRKALKPLEAAPMIFSSEKADLGRAGQQPLLRRTCVLRALAKFSVEADSVGKKIDQLVAEDKKRTVPKSQPNAPPKSEPVETPAAKTAPAETAPGKTAPADTSTAKNELADTDTARNPPDETSQAKIAAADTAPAKTASAATAPGKTAPADTSTAKNELADTDTARTPPDETSPAKIAPADTALAKTAPAETAPAKTAPTEPAPRKTASAEILTVETALAESALGKSSPAESTPAETVSAKAAPAETALAQTLPAETATLKPAQQ